MFEHGGVRMAFDAADPAQLQRLQEARAYLGGQLARMTAEWPEDIATCADQMEACVLAVCELFDSLFGQGTANALFGGEISDFEVAMAAYEALEAHVENQTQPFVGRIEKYLPEGYSA